VKDLPERISLENHADITNFPDVHHLLYFS